MVMSQAAIDALINVGDDSDKAEAPEPEPADAPVAEQASDPGSELTPEELAIVAEAAEAAAEVDAEPPSAATPAAQPNATRPKMRTLSVGATNTDADLKDRVQDLEDKLGIIESSVGRVGEADSDEVEELKTSLTQVAATVQSLVTAVHQLTEHSQGSLGFAAKQKFDCPECGSHGTISVPISCTSCGHEAEWGFWPEQ